MSAFIDGLRRAGRVAKQTANKARDRLTDYAMDNPRVQARVDQARQQLAEVKKGVEAQLAQAESELWAWINRLQAEAQRAHRQQLRRKTSSEYYEVLGLAPGADLATIKKAFRQQMRAHHPDRFAHDPVAEQQAHAQAQRINEAYRELTALLTGRESRRSG